MNKLSYSKEYLPLHMLAGEQGAVALVPPETFVTESDKAFMEQVAADTSDDKIIYAYTDSGISKNKRNWGGTIMESIGEQVVSKKPVGYLGHIKPTDYGFDFPDPQVVWFGSASEQLENKETRLWLKGYVLPTATNLKTWIKTKAVDSISVYGNIGYKDEQGVKTIQSVDLKSIDISRKLGEGLNAQIIGLAGEMDASYDDVRHQLEQQVKDRVKASRPVAFHADGTLKSNYVYAYVSKMFVGKSEAIVSVDNYEDNGNILFRCDYTIDDKPEVPVVTLGTMKEVEKRVDYVDKKSGAVLSTIEPSVVGFGLSDPIAKGEMNSGASKIDGGAKVMKLHELKAQDPEGYRLLVAEIGAEMATDAAQKAQLVKVETFNKVVEIFGGEQEGIVEAVKTALTANQAFLGEMATIFCGEQEAPTVEAVVEAAKATVVAKTEAEAVIAEVKDIVKPADGVTLADATKEVVVANQVAIATTWIGDVNEAFVELSETEIDGVEIDETVLSFVRDDFQQLLDIKPEDVTEADWKEKSIKYMQDNFEASVKKYTARLSKVSATAKASGEMNFVTSMMENIVGEQSSKASSANEDPDVALAKSLGFN